MIQGYRLGDHRPRLLPDPEKEMMGNEHQLISGMLAGLQYSIKIINIPAYGGTACGGPSK
jgi:hypothetical protein